jgi:tRNA(Ile)-lysidine synthase
MQADGVSEFLQQAEAEIQKRHLLSRGQKILVAVSGGADSMVLLHVLHLLAQRNRWKIFVAHFNHQLRGRASDADEKLVRSVAKKLSLPFFSERGEVARYARQSKISVEMAARKLRHEFLARVAREQKTSIIALAHHADDQVELFFLRLLRGAGGEGLAGMKWRSPSPADKKITLVRPLLGFTKAELLAFARAKKIRFRDDATNVSNDFLRNRIRNELLPLLRKNYQPAADKTILRLMDIVGAEAEFAGATAQAWLAKPGMAFGRLPVAVQRKVLQRQLTERGIVADFELVEQLREAQGKFVSVAAHLSVACDSSGQIELRELFENEFKKNELKLKLQGRAGRVEFSGRKFRWQIQPQKKFRRPPKRDGLEMFDADKVGGEIVLRHWRAGDRFQPIGLQSAVKLQDLFVNAKIAAALRRDLVLAATAAGEIFWVEGLRLGERFKLTPLTQRKLLWNQPQLPA